MQPTRRHGRLERPGCNVYYEAVGKVPRSSSRTAWAAITCRGFSKSPTSPIATPASPSPIAASHRRRPSPAAPNPADYAGDLAALVEHLNLTDVRIVAQSMGGWSTVEYALTKPAGLKAIVLAGTTGTIDPLQIEDPERTRIAQWLQTDLRERP